MYNVWRNNAIPYDPAVKDGNLQARYWYFRPVVGILGVEQIPLRPDAAVAGDVWNVGLGKLVALSWDGPYGPEVHLVVLADTGGAFQPNLFQLDWLAGAFPSAEAFADWEKTMPNRVRAAVLIRKREG
jgi:membrane-bound lytic murein transglycosylase